MKYWPDRARPTCFFRQATADGSDFAPGKARKYAAMSEPT
jgi:hypothetical protein